MRILSGIQPSGQLHLGNFFGMMKRMVEYQTSHELFCFVVNYHALTTQHDGALLKRLTWEAVLDFLALGLDPDQSTFWIQSDLPEVTELTWILSNHTPFGLLERSHSYKDKVSQGIKPSHGLFSYPVLMTADILMMQAERIPVGKDQKQHVEIAQDIAEKFNHQYGSIFVRPEPDIEDSVSIIPGLDGRKMSKSYDNTIEIFGTQEQLKQKVMGIKTDSTPVNDPKPTTGNPLYEIYRLFLSPGEQQKLKERFEGSGLKYGEVKKELIDVIWTYFAPYRKKRDELSKDPDKIRRILKQGKEKAKAQADITIARVREVVGLTY